MLIGKIILKNSYSTLSNAILKLSRYDFNSIILKKNSIILLAILIK